MSEKRIAASTPCRRTGCSVISVTRSGRRHASSIAMPSRTAAVLRQRPARLAHEPDRRVRDGLAPAGTRGTGSQRSSCHGHVMLPCRGTVSCNGVARVPTRRRSRLGSVSWRHPPRSPETFARAVAGLRGGPAARRRSCSKRWPRRSGSRRTASRSAPPCCVTDDEVATGRLILLHDPERARRLGRHAAPGHATSPPNSNRTWPPTRCWPRSAGAGSSTRWMPAARSTPRGRHGHPDGLHPLRRPRRPAGRRRHRAPRLLDPDRRRPRPAPLRLVHPARVDRRPAAARHHAARLERRLSFLPPLPRRGEPPPRRCRAAAEPLPRHRRTLAAPPPNRPPNRTVRTRVP